MKRHHAAVLTLLACAFTNLVSHAQAQQPQAPEPEFVVASRQYQEGHQADALVVLQRLAQEGDARAQYLVGLDLVEGKYIARDVAQGFAWIVIAGRGRDELVAPMAIAARREIEPQLSGTDLIHADQLVAAYVETPRQKALQALYAKDGGPAQHTVPGCAREPKTPGCEAALGAGVNAAVTCRGVDVVGDRDATLDASKKLEAPDWEATALRLGTTQGSVLVALHVDASGFVCSAGVAQTSGQPEMDTAAVRAISHWQYVPALQGTRAVDDARLVRLTYDYAN
jgi:TonB family protein